MDCSPPGSSVPEILQARTLEWIAISFSRGSSQRRDWTQVSYTAARFFTIWTSRESPPYWLGFIIKELGFYLKKKVLIIECWKSSGFLFTHLSSISIKRGSQTLHGLFSGKQLWHMKLGEERGDQRTEPASVSQRRRKGLWEKELAPRAFGCSHPSKPLIYPAGRKGPSPAATREDESGSPWAGTATFPLACQRQRMDFKGLDMASHQPINLHVAFYRKNNLIFLIKK